MNFQNGQLWVTLQGNIAHLHVVRPEDNVMLGVIRMEDGKLKGCRWKCDGQVDANGFVGYRLISLYDKQPFTTWMCKIGVQPPMPAPNEEIAKEWAKKSSGRAFRVVEIIE